MTAKDIWGGAWRLALIAILVLLAFYAAAAFLQPSSGCNYARGECGGCDPSNGGCDVQPWY